MNTYIHSCYMLFIKYKLQTLIYKYIYFNWGFRRGSWRMPFRYIEWEKNVLYNRRGRVRAPSLAADNAIHSCQRIFGAWWRPCRKCRADGSVAACLYLLFACVLALFFYFGSLSFGFRHLDPRVIIRPPPWPKETEQNGRGKRKT